MISLSLQRVHNGLFRNRRPVIGTAIGTPNSLEQLQLLKRHVISAPSTQNISALVVTQYPEFYPRSNKPYVQLPHLAPHHFFFYKLKPLTNSYTGSTP